MTKKIVQPPTITIRRRPGKHKSFLETGHYVQSVKVRLPVLTVTGARPGPLAVIMAGQHGRELNGVAAIERVFNELDPQSLKGTVVFLPVLNPLAVLTRRQDYPVEEFRYRRMGLNMLTPRPAGPDRNYNMDLCWLERPTADSYVFAVTGAVWQTWLRHADWSIDLHGWSDAFTPLAWSMRPYAGFLRNFGLPWHQLRAPRLNDPDAGMTLTRTYAAGIPHIVAELPPQNIIDPVSMAYGRRGILNSLKFTGMLAGRPELPPLQYELRQGDKDAVIVTGAEGLLIGEIPTGAWARKGQLVARVFSLETFETVWSFTAPFDGLVFSSGRGLWGEDIREQAVVYPRMRVGMMRKVAQVIRNRGAK